jgi:signal transduction histidine kinase
MFFERFRLIRKTVGFRLAVWSSAVFIVSSLMLFVVTYFLLSSSLEEKDRDAIQLKLKTYAEEYEAGGLLAFTRRIESERDSGKLRDHIVRLADAKASTLLLVPPDDGTPYDYKELSNFSTDSNHWTQLHAIGEDDILDVASARLSDGSLLQVGGGPDEREDVLDRFRNKFIIILAGVFAFGIGGGTFLSSRALRPVRGIIAALHPIIETDKLKARVPVEATGDEIEQLSRLLNQALERIDCVVESMRESLDNVAHDLRTPMTRLRGIAEMALSSKPDLENYREALSDSLEESGTILAMLNTLMEISEAEASSTRLELTEMNFSEVVEQVVEMYRLVAEERDISIEAKYPQDLRVVADRSRLVQAVANLMDNAVKYTPNGGRVDVEVQSSNCEVILTVRDTGVGIPANEAGKIWDRSYRGDASRAQRGLGLGLSLVKAVVQAHKGSVVMSSELGSGSCFTLHLPLTSA